MNNGFINKDFRFWRYLVNFWSVCFIALIICDFLVNNAYADILSILSIVYISVLAIYVGNKEFERWYDHHRAKHPGEIFVIIWTVLVFTLIILDFIFDKSYQLPGSVLSAYVAVLTILAITNKSKELYSTHSREKKTNKIINKKINLCLQQKQTQRKKQLVKKQTPKRTNSRSTGTNS